MDNVVFFIDRKEVQKTILNIIANERNRGTSFYNFWEVTEEQREKADQFITSFALGSLPKQDAINFKSWCKRHNILFSTHSPIFSNRRYLKEDLEIFYSYNDLLGAGKIAYPLIYDYIRQGNKRACKIYDILQLGYDVYTYKEAKSHFKIDPKKVDDTYIGYAPNNKTSQECFLFNEELEEEKLLYAFNIFIKHKKVRLTNIVKIYKDFTKKQYL